MSISRVQRDRVMEAIAKVMFMSGEKPALSQIARDASSFFAKNPIGQPFNAPVDSLAGSLVSDPDAFNNLMANAIVNLEVLYAAANIQIKDILEFTSILNAELDRLQGRRKQLTSRIDDYMFSMYNTDGYFYSFSDNFAGLSYVDLSMTSAHVDMKYGCVSIPADAATSKVIDNSRLSNASFSIERLINGVPSGSVTGSETSPISNAFDGLTNTAWVVELETSEPTELIGRLFVNFNTADEPVVVSKVGMTPFGMTPVQVYVDVIEPSVGGTSTDTHMSLFGGKVIEDTLPMSWSDNPVNASGVILTMRKTEPDVVLSNGGKTRYRYIFGARDIIISEHAYDNNATFVTKPIPLPGDISDEEVIDAVSLVVDSMVPPDTAMDFYVASNVEAATTVEQFDWKKITPMDSLEDRTDGNLITFGGAVSNVVRIVENPKGSDLQIIAEDLLNKDPKKRNPTVIDEIPEVDIWRLARFEAEHITSSLSLEEGVNTTRVFYLDRKTDAMNLEFWKDYVGKEAVKKANTYYGTIDSGDGFFYGGSLGNAGLSVYMETYIESPMQYSALLRDVAKLDSNSKQWHVKVFFNGNEVGDLPVGVDQLQVKWKFNKGLNHIALLVDIPQNTKAYPQVYVGQIDLMVGSKLWDFGTVKLDTWDYVDIFHMKYNEHGEPKTFTILDGEIISRRKPTTNFRLKYARSSHVGPSSIRLKAEMSRSQSNPNVSPLLNSYRLRFRYAS